MTGSCASDFQTAAACLSTLLRIGPSAERYWSLAYFPLTWRGVESWPSAVPVQVHYTAGDPFRRQDWIDELRADVQEAGASFEMFEYEGEGHLFTDPSRPHEFQSDDAELVWKRVLTFAPLDR